MARKMSSRVGCFSTYSTLAGGKSCFSSARVPFALCPDQHDPVGPPGRSAAADHRGAAVAGPRYPGPARDLAAYGGTAGILREQAPPPLNTHAGADAVVVSADNALT